MRNRMKYLGRGFDVEQLERRNLLAVDTYVFEGVVELVEEQVIDFAQEGQRVAGRIAVKEGDPSSILSLELAFGEHGFTCQELDIDRGDSEIFITSDCSGLPDVYFSIGWNGAEFVAGNGYYGQETDVPCSLVDIPCEGLVHVPTVDASITSIELFEPKVEAVLFPNATSEFGPYLQGVKLDETFEVELPFGLAPLVQRFDLEFSAAERDPTVTKAADRNAWQYQFDAGAIRRDDDLTFTVHWTDGTDQSATGQFKLQESAIDVELFIKVDGQSGGGDPIEDVRLIDSVPLGRNVELRAEVSGLTEQQETHYGSRLDVFVIPEGSREQSIFEAFIAQETGKSDFDALELSAGNHKVVVKAADSEKRKYRTRDIELSETSQLNVAELPDWISKHLVQDGSRFELGGQVGDAFSDPDAAGYHFELGIPDAGGKAIATEEISPEGLVKAFAKEFDERFKSLGTQIEFGLDLDVFAKLSSKSDGIVELAGWRYGATLLGTELVKPESGRIDEDGIRGSVDGKDLELNGLDINRSLNLKQLLGLEAVDAFRIEFGGQSPIQMPLPVPGFSVSAMLQGVLIGELQSLNANVDMSIRLIDGQLAFDNSQIIVNTVASASLELQAGVGVNVSILPQLIEGIPVASAVATGTISLEFVGALPIMVSGQVLSPNVQFASPTARVALDYDFDWNVCIFSKDCQPEQPPVVARDKDVAHFGEPTPYSPTESGTLQGDGVKSHAGFPGAAPQGRSGMAVLGRIPSSQRNERRLQRQSELVLPDGLGNISAVELDRNLLADAALLRPKHHYLEIVAVGPDHEVELAQFDLSEMTLDTNDNPFGFASGWQPLRIPVELDQLNGGQDYNVAFRLLADEDATENVGVALDRIRFVSVQGEVQLFVKDAPFEETVLEVASDAVDQATPLSIRNVGSGMVVVDTVEIVGNGFVLEDAPTPGSGIAPGQALDFSIRAVGPPNGASGLLRIVAEDPRVSPVEIELVPIGQLQGDFDLDGKLSIEDLDLLSIAIHEQNSDERFDLNDDGRIDLSDRIYWVKVLADTSFGDANLDGIFDSGDLIAVFRAGRFEKESEASWSQGDWDGDGFFSTSDLVAAFKDGAYLA